MNGEDHFLVKFDLLSVETRPHKNSERLPSSIGVKKLRHVKTSPDLFKNT